MTKKVRKILSMILVFVLTVVNYGFPLQAMAAEGSSFFRFGFLKKDEIELKAYFDGDEDSTDKSANVNDVVNLTIEVTPLIEEYLKEGVLKLNLKNGNSNNFKIKSIRVEGDESEIIESEKETKEEEKVEVENSDVSNKIDDSEEFTQNLKTENVVEETKKEDSVIENTVSNISLDNVSTAVIDDVTSKIEIDNVSSNRIVSSLEEDEEITPIDEATLEQEILSEVQVEEEEEVIGNYEVRLISDNEIKLTNIIDATKIFAEIEFNQSENLNVNDLYSEIEVTLDGDYINEDLEIVEITESEELTLGWEYTKEIEVSSEYTKISPFVVGEIKGTILENEITVIRNIQDEKFLPIKETKLEIQIPEINGSLPIGITVTSDKLMATLGTSFENIEFTEDNWNYDENTGLLEIIVKNNDLAFGSGEDKFDIICRYEEYISEEIISLEKNVLVIVEEYNSDTNIIQEINIEDIQTEEVKAGELMSCSTVDTDAVINKGLITANFYTNAGYETEFSNIVNLSILTSDILEDIMIEASKEAYVNKSGNELDAAEDIKFKGIKFKDNEIKEMLEKGSTIDVLDENGMVLHTITKDDANASIVFDNKVDNVKIRINKVQVNKNLSVEFIKTIDKSIYSIEDLKALARVENSYDVKVKYIGFEDIFKISEVRSVNGFANPKTDVSFFMDRTSLSAIHTNENVEFRIELMNDKETSDLYRNPSFEIVFPKYVKEVTINSLNILYKNGLSILNHEVVNENGYIKLKIDLEGTQSEFNFSNLTNGTNIVLNANIKVDELTPSTQEAIKLYYYNETATNYTKELNWSMSKTMPAHTTVNGYDYVYFTYQTLTGFVTSNGMTNYDGLGNNIQTVKQGKITANVDMLSGVKVVTMNLASVNNTGNDCSDVVMIGRVPNKEATDVITGEKIETNIDTQMVSGIVAAESNEVYCDIYYSTKADADKNIENRINEWTKEPSNINEVKSFLIVPTETVEAGEILKFSYNFQVPENLPYDSKIYGNFGAYYNNHLSYETMYESTKADTVGLETDPGPKLAATLSVDVGDGAIVDSGSRIRYTIKVENIGSIEATGINVTAPIPENTTYIVKGSHPDYGDLGYEEKADKREVTYKIDSLKPGESHENTYCVKVGYALSLEKYADGKDEEGYYKETDGAIMYITEVPPMIITNQVVVASEILANPVVTNTVTNELDEVLFLKETGASFDRPLNPGLTTTFRFMCKNISGKDLENGVIAFDIGQVYEYTEGKVTVWGETLEADIEYNKEEGKVYFTIGKIENNAVVIVEALVTAKEINTMRVSHDCRFEIKADGMDEPEYGTALNQRVEIPWVDVEDITVGLPETINEGEKAQISILVANMSAREITDAILECAIPECLEVLSIKTTGTKDLNPIVNEEGKVSDKLPIIGMEKAITVDIVVQAKNMPGVDPTKVLLDFIIKNGSQPDVNASSIEFTIINSEKTEAEIIAEEKEKFEQAEKEYWENHKNDNPNGEDGKHVGDTTEDTVDPNVPQGNGGSADGSQASGENTNQGSNDGSNVNTNNGDNNGTSSSNGSNSNSSNNSNGGSTSNKQEETKPVETPKYNITGRVWEDTNKNGTRDNKESGMDGVKVHLMDSKNNVLKTTTTNNGGKYTFDKLENGKYIVAFSFDTNLYEITTYMKSNVPDTNNSDAIKVESGNMNAITNVMTVSDANIANVDLGLQTKDIFDMEVGKYISKVTVTTNKGTKTYEYDNEEIAKVDIHSKQINGAKVELEYTIKVENKGDVEGYAEQIKDYVPADVNFDESKNKDWYKGTDGSVYVKDSNKVLLKAGEVKEYKLYLTKTMNENNTGILSNKVDIVTKTEDATKIDDKENNTSVQNTIITVSTGATTKVIIVGIIIIAVIVGIKYNKVIVGIITGNKVYKTKEKKAKKKIDFKKNFK